MENTLQEIEKFAESAENSRIRAELWGDFVGWDNRRRGEDGFLVNQLKAHKAKKVLDVALGDGVDTIYLLQQGFDVSANEIDDAFRSKAIENARREGFLINPTNLDRQNLSSKYQESSFDALICLGNSLTCVFGRANQIATLRQFCQLLKQGVLLIDERNYQRMLDNREAVIAGTLHSSGKYLYTGTEKVRARFIELNDNHVLIEYNHREEGKAYYKGYPYKRGEILRLLREVGFSKIEQFSDYEPGVNSDADFYQYVCVK